LTAEFPAGAQIDGKASRDDFVLKWLIRGLWWNVIRLGAGKIVVINFRLSFVLFGLPSRNNMASLAIFLEGLYLDIPDMIALIVVDSVDG